MSQHFTYKQITQSEFNDLVKSLEPQHIPIEQTLDWGKFDDSQPGRKFLGSFSYEQDGRFIALASATLYQQKGRNWIWIKHGPIYASEPNTETVKKMCSTLKAQFSSVENVQPIFVRLSSSTKSKPLVMPFEHTMYDETVVIDLTKSEEEILSEMSQGGRQGIRRATKAGVQVSELKDVESFEKTLYPILSETASRSGFGVHPSSLYASMLENLNSSKLYAATLNGKPVAWAITTEYNQTALYYYGASNNEARDSYAPYLLHWEIIKDMKARGNKTYDFMGIAGKNYPSLANVTTFKLKFSKNVVRVTQAYDLPIRPLKYLALSLAIKLKRKLK
jgi:lipid II:glycine glycyltransferase (peptidoglycan interpeptide bridge formation enzyme)